MWYKRAQFTLQEPYEFNYVRNPSSAPGFGEEYGQHIEPAGKYMIEQYLHHVPENWESGRHGFSNPFIIEFGGSYKEPSNWKHRLSTMYGKTGKDLTLALLADGYDGIITHNGKEIQEMIDLTTVKH